MGSSCNSKNKWHKLYNKNQLQYSMHLRNAKLQEMYSKVASNIATARERHGRSESNIGLFEED